MGISKYLILIMFGISCQAQNHKEVEKLNIAELESKASAVEGSVVLPDGSTKSVTSYHYEHEQNGVLIQVSGNPVTGFQQIEIPPLPEVFILAKTYYPNGVIKSKGQTFKKNFFEKGVWTYYDADGNLKETIDKDAPFTKYPWEQVQEFLKKRNVTFAQIHAIVRQADQHAASWTISYIKDRATEMGEIVTVDVATGKVSNVKEQSFRKELD